MAIQQGEGKTRQKILRFFAYTIIIPFLIVLLLLFLYGLVFRVNIFELARDYLAEQDRIAALTSEHEFYEKQLERMKEELESERTRNEQLQEQIEEKEREIAELTLEVEQREQERTASASEKAEVKSDASLVKTFLAMKPKHAASIIIQMEEDVALDILVALDEEALAAILEKMPPEKAANFTSRLARLTGE